MLLLLLLLHTVRFLCSVAAAFARLVKELRKRKAAAAMAFSAPAALSAASHPIGLIASTPLPAKRSKKTLGQAQFAVPEGLLVSPSPPPVQPVVVAPPPAVLLSDSDVVTGVAGMLVDEQAHRSVTKKKAAWAARRRPSRLVVPVADEAAAPDGWAAPVKEADDVEMVGEGFWLASRAGPRHAMEDAYAVVTHKNHGSDSHQLAFYGVFDGHGGRAVVDFVSERLSKNVVSAVLAAGTETPEEASSSSSAPADREEEDAVAAAIRAAYLDTDSELLTQHQGASGGACAATALVKGGDLYVAHLGDCRAVLSRDGAAAALTADHTCAAEGERARIERGGGYVSRSGSGSGVWRVQGSLAVSRAFGDGALKQWVVAEPAVTRVPLAAGCEFLVIASDGLWDKVSNQEAVDAVARSRATACRDLVGMARRRGSRDDVTVMVVDLGRFVR